MTISAKSRILAVDFGDARTGLAATDWTGSITVPLPRIDSRDQQEVVRAIVELTHERDSETIVVGMPLTLDGSHGERARHTEQFVARLRAAVACPVDTIDESHTTDEAHERLKQGGLKAKRRKDLADSIAALVILERYRGQLSRRPPDPAGAPGEPPEPNE